MTYWNTLSWVKMPRFYHEWWDGYVDFVNFSFFFFFFFFFFWGGGGGGGVCEKYECTGMRFVFIQTLYMPFTAGGNKHLTKYTCRVLSLMYPDLFWVNDISSNNQISGRGSVKPLWQMCSDEDQPSFVQWKLHRCEKNEMITQIPYKSDKSRSLTSYKE